MAEASNQVAAANGLENEDNNDHLIQSSDPQHPANLIPEMCRKFYTWGWVTGTGGGVSAYNNSRSSSIAPIAYIDLTDVNPSWRSHFHCPVRRAKGADTA